MPSLEQIADRYGADRVQIGREADGRCIVLANGVAVGAGWTAEAAAAAALGNAARIHLIDEHRGLIGIYPDRSAARRDRQQILAREPGRSLAVVDADPHSEGCPSWLRSTSTPTTPTR